MGMGKPIRVQGTFVSDGEVHKVIAFVKEQVAQGQPAYNEDVLTRIEHSNVQDSAEDTDDLLPDAIELWSAADRPPSPCCRDASASDTTVRQGSST